MGDALDIFIQFAIISLLAFGGGGVVLGLVERLAVQDRGWITAEEFAGAVGFTFVTPGPILVMAPFVGYLAAGFPGAVAGSVGVFILPWAMAMGAARRLHRYMDHPRLRGFGAGATPAIIGLFSLAVLTLARTGFTNLGYVGIGLIAALLMAKTKLHPVVIIVIGAGLGLVVEIDAIASVLPGVDIP